MKSHAVLNVGSDKIEFFFTGYYYNFSNAFNLQQDILLQKILVRKTIRYIVFIYLENEKHFPTAAVKGEQRFALQ